VKGMGKQYKPLEEALGYEFRDKTLLQQALTHRSYGAAVGGKDYERLEFLGDAVLQLVVSTYLYSKFSNLREGQLAKIRAYLVSEPTLAELGKKLKLDSFLRVGKGEEQTGVHQRASVLCDVVEAVYGAVYLDGGFAEAERIILAHMPEWDPSQLPLIDAKTTLQEHFQQLSQKTPTYTLAEESGPAHNKQFVVEVRFEDELLGVGYGRSKKEAAQEAARAALANLDIL